MTEFEALNVALDLLGQKRDSLIDEDWAEEEPETAEVSEAIDVLVRLRARL